MELVTNIGHSSEKSLYKASVIYWNPPTESIEELKVF